MNAKEAKRITGGLSYTAKMPCPSFGLAAKDCKVGSKLRGIENSTCSKCYACRGSYLFDNVQACHKRRLEGLTNPLWVEAMVFQIQNFRYFRWHDSGDIQSLEHLRRIVEVCLKTPDTKHWLPTREVAIVKKYLKGYRRFPGNLTVRISASMIDKLQYFIAGTVSSSVHKFDEAKGIQCSAQNGTCCNCRDCWDFSIRNISYQYH